MGGCEDGCWERVWVDVRKDVGWVWVDVRTDVGKGMGGCEDGCGEGHGWM